MGPVALGQWQHIMARAHVIKTIHSIAKKHKRKKRGGRPIKVSITSQLHHPGDQAFWHSAFEGPLRHSWWKAFSSQNKTILGHDSWVDRNTPQPVTKLSLEVLRAPKGPCLVRMIGFIIYPFRRKASLTHSDILFFINVFILHPSLSFPSILVSHFFHLNPPLLPPPNPLFCFC